jgi:hypothetical protein
MHWFYFWRRKRLAAADTIEAEVKSPVPATVAVAPAPDSDAPAKEDTAQLPLVRMVLALALRDEGDVALLARPELLQAQQLLVASRELSRVGTEPRYTPHRPSLLPQLLEVLNVEDASLRALARIVAQDAQLTGELLRSANSPFHRVSELPVESVERATAVLGTQGMRTLIAQRLLQPLASVDKGANGVFGEVIWQHALYSASAAEAL